MTMKEKQATGMCEISLFSNQTLFKIIDEKISASGSIICQELPLYIGHFVRGEAPRKKSYFTDTDWVCTCIGSTHKNGNIIVSIYAEREKEPEKEKVLLGTYSVPCNGRDDRGLFIQMSVIGARFAFAAEQFIHRNLDEYDMHYIQDRYRKMFVDLYEPTGSGHKRVYVYAAIYRGIGEKADAEDDIREAERDAQWLLNQKDDEWGAYGYDFRKLYI